MLKSVEDKLLAARTSLMWDHPFFAALAMQLETIDATDDPRIDTMATDGKRLYVHGPFVESLKKDELVFVLAHEVMHNALQHHIRRQARDPSLWNIAADYCINGDAPYEVTQTQVASVWRELTALAMAQGTASLTQQPAG